MKRSGNETESLVYSYRCGDPHAGMEAALAEQQRARALWDRLVDIDDQARRAETDQARADDPDLALLIDRIIAIKAELTPLYEARSKVRQRERRKAATQYDERIAELDKQRREVRTQIWALLAAWRKSHGEAVKAIEAERRARIVEARQNSGMYWGNYNRVIDDYDRSRSRGRKTGRMPRRSDPDRDDGCLTVQIQRTSSGLGGAPGELFEGRVGALTIAPVDPRAHDPMTPRGERGRLCRTTVTMRVDVEGATITLPLVLHRPLPSDCRIKRAQLTFRRVGPRLEWHLALTLTKPAVNKAHAAPGTYCGLDLGWRKLITDAVRVAYLVGSDGATRSIEQSAEWHAGMDHVEDLRSRIDDMDLDGVRSREAREMTGLRGRLLRQRREFYRLLSREIAMRYEWVAIDDNDLGELARSDKSVAGGLRVRASLSEFVRELDHQCSKHGAKLVRVTGPTTAVCHACGAHNNPQDRTDMIWRCASCGVMWDQDENAARNLLLFAVANANASAEKKEEPADGITNDLQSRTARPKRTPRITDRKAAAGEDLT